MVHWRVKGDGQAGQWERVQLTGLSSPWDLLQVLQLP